MPLCGPSRGLLYISGSMKVCLAVLNRDGRDHLAELLPTATRAVREYGQGCPIVVLDNESPGDDLAWLRTNYPEVEGVSQRNDFLFSYNRLLANRDEDVVILLNNDLKVSANFIGAMVRHFAEPSVFAVSCKAFNWEGDRLNSGPCLLKVLRRGWIVTGCQLDRQVLSYTLFASGGFMAVDRRKFLALGGFDPLFYPAYGEDKDLCFRAWCRGWTSLYEPECYVFHREGGSWDRGRHRSRRLIEISNYLFTWRNFRRPWFRAAHRVYLTWLTVRKRIEGDGNWVESFREARRLWRERRREALAGVPQVVDLGGLQRMCGSPVAERARGEVGCAA